jgi:hypothetical protein
MIVSKYWGAMLVGWFWVFVRERVKYANFWGGLCLLGWFVKGLNLTWARLKSCGLESRAVCICADSHCKVSRISLKSSTCVLKMRGWTNAPKQWKSGPFIGNRPSWPRPQWSILWPLLPSQPITIESGQYFDHFDFSLVRDWSGWPKDGQLFGHEKAFTQRWMSSTFLSIDPKFSQQFWPFWPMGEQSGQYFGHFYPSQPMALQSGQYFDHETMVNTLATFVSSKSVKDGQLTNGRREWSILWPLLFSFILVSQWQSRVVNTLTTSLFLRQLETRRASTEEQKMVNSLATFASSKSVKDGQLFGHSFRSNQWETRVVNTLTTFILVYSSQPMAVQSGQYFDHFSFASFNNEKQISVPYHMIRSHYILISLWTELKWSPKSVRPWAYYVHANCRELHRILCFKPRLVNKQANLGLKHHKDIGHIIFSREHGVLRRL